MLTLIDTHSMNPEAEKTPFNSSSLTEANSGSDLKQRIEYMLEAYFIHAAGIDKEALYLDDYYEPGIFRQLLPWASKNVVAFFSSRLQIDLNNNPMFAKLQEIMLAPEDGALCSCREQSLKNEVYLVKYFFELLP